MQPLVHVGSGFLRSLKVARKPLLKLLPSLSCGNCMKLWNCDVMWTEDVLYIVVDGLDLFFNDVSEDCCAALNSSVRAANLTSCLLRIARRFHFDTEFDVDYMRYYEILWDIMRYMIVFHGPIIVSYRIHEKKSLKGDREERPKWCSLGPVESGEWSFLPTRSLMSLLSRSQVKESPAAATARVIAERYEAPRFMLSPNRSMLHRGADRGGGTEEPFESLSYVCLWPMAAGLCHAWVLLLAADNVWWPMPIGLYTERIRNGWHELKWNLRKLHKICEMCSTWGPCKRTASSRHYHVNGAVTSVAQSQLGWF